MAQDGDESVGVYISVPFCRAKCSFCNFSSDVGSAGSLDRYVATLCREIETARSRTERLGLQMPSRAVSVYFGGGTPSLLEPAQLRRIFEALRASFGITPEAEITLEAAPGQIDDDLLAEAQRQGVNRISLGVQSFIDAEAAAVGRLHTGRQALDEVSRLRLEGIAEVGVDLIAGLPHQTTDSWQTSLEAAAGSEATHLSVYMLEVDEDSRLGREVLAGGARFHARAVGSEELIAELYETTCEWLPAHGFAQYEISNFARSEVRGDRGAFHQSHHNRRYWERAPYIGFGLDAHSMLFSEPETTAVRFAKGAERHDYDLGVFGALPTAVSLREAFEETLFLGLRLIEGVCLQGLRAAWPTDWVANCGHVAAELVADGLMSQEGQTIALTLRGRLLSNEVFGRLLETHSVGEPVTA